MYTIMFKYLFLSTILSITFQKCLKPKVLQSLGLKPLLKPISLLDSSLCTELFKTHKTCVDEKQLGIFLGNLYNYVHFKDKAVINSIYDDIKEIARFFPREILNLNSSSPKVM